MHRRIALCGVGAAVRRTTSLRLVHRAASRPQLRLRSLHVQRWVRQAEQAHGSAGGGSPVPPPRSAWKTGLKVLGSFLAVNVAVVFGGALYVRLNLQYAPPESMFAELDAQPGVSLVTLKDGRKLAVKEHGPKSGRPVFLFAAESLFDPEICDLSRDAAAVGVRVIAVSRPGHGRSDAALGHTLLSWADDVVQLADGMGIDKFAVMGLNTGGPFALACAYKLPREYPGRLCGVGLVCAHGSYLNDDLPETLSTDDNARVCRDNAALFSTYTVPFAQVARLLVFKAPFVLALMLAVASRPDDVVLTRADKKMTTRGLQEALRGGVEGWYRDLMLQYAEPWGFEVADIKLDTGRVWLWHGEKDRVPVAWGRYFASHIDDCVASFPPNEGRRLLWDQRAREILEDVASAVPPPRATPSSRA